jgi:hypothetical protein
MSNQIDNAPVHTPFPSGLISQDPVWSKWFLQLVNALFRPTVTQSISFPSTGAQKSADVTVTFPKNTVALTDIPCMQAPAPPANTCFTCHIAAVDQVVIRFNNYSNAAVAVAAANFSVTVLKQ